LTPLGVSNYFLQEMIALAPEVLKVLKFGEWCSYLWQAVGHHNATEAA